MHWPAPFDKRIDLIYFMKMLDDNQQSLPVELLRTFVAAVDAGSFTRAGERVCRTQSAVSMQMKRLEELVGTPLFLRSARSVESSPTGEVLVRYARRLLRLNDEAMAAVRGSGLRGRVRLGAPEDYASTVLPEILAHFSRHAPEVLVEVYCSPHDEVAELLDAGRLDLGLLTSGDDSGPGEAVHREPVVWAIPRDMTPESVEQLPLAVFHAGCIYRGWTLEALERQGRSYRVAYESPSTAAIVSLVGAGLAVAPVGRSIPAPGCRKLAFGEGLPPLPTATIMLRRGAGREADPVAGELARHVAHSFREISA